MGEEDGEWGDMYADDGPRENDDSIMSSDETVTRCRVTCADFSMNVCDTPHRCVKPDGHPFSPGYGEIHEFETHPTTVKAPVQATAPEDKATPQGELWRQLSECVEYIRNDDVHDAALQIIAELARVNSRETSALAALLKLIEDGDLVRNTTKDDDFDYFMHQGVRITKAIALAHAALPAPPVSQPISKANG